MKNIQKFASLITLFAMIVMLAVPFVASAQFTVPNIGSNTKLPGDSTASEFVIRIINILLAIAALIAVIYLIIGGFRYITAAGNEENAEAAKKTITNAIIGIVVIILAFVIVRVIANALVSSNV